MREVPRITDFDFIKTLGKGGFATVYMGKNQFCFEFECSAQTNDRDAICNEDGKKILNIS
jgi:hypothetical protein